MFIMIDWLTFSNIKQPHEFAEYQILGADM